MRHLVRQHPLALMLCAALGAQDTGVHFVHSVDGSLEMPYAPQVVPQSGLTVEAWVTYDDRIPTGQNRAPTVVRQNVGTGNESFFLRVNAGTTAATVLRFRVTTAAAILLVDHDFGPGGFLNWTHVAATYDGAEAVLYVNGTRVSSVAGNGQPLRDRGGVLRIGKGDDGVGRNEVWNGGIDELRLWPFARTQAEIQATMHQKLRSVPGLVATWNFDSSLVDSSSGLVLVASGNAPFAANPLTLATPSMPAAAGASTPGCLGSLLLSPSAAARRGNAAYAAVCTRTPPNALALWLLSPSVLANPIPFFGVNLWVHPAAVVTLFGTADGLGALRLGLPLPNGPLGAAIALQTFVLDACGRHGLTATNVLVTTLVP